MSNEQMDFNTSDEGSDDNVEVEIDDDDPGVVAASSTEAHARLLAMQARAPAANASWRSRAQPLAPPAAHNVPSQPRLLIDVVAPAKKKKRKSTHGWTKRKKRQGTTAKSPSSCKDVKPTLSELDAVVGTTIDVVSPLPSPRQEPIPDVGHNEVAADDHRARTRAPCSL